MSGRKSIFIALLGLLVLSPGCSKNKGKKAELERERAKKLAQPGVVQRTYTLKNYSRPCCPNLMDYVLEEVDCFIQSRSDTEAQTLAVWFDSTKCNEQEIKDAINETQYSIVAML